jgi:hypothetical protein
MLQAMIPRVLGGNLRFGVFKRDIYVLLYVLHVLLSVLLPCQQLGDKLWIVSAVDTHRITRIVPVRDMLCDAVPVP